MYYQLYFNFFTYVILLQPHWTHFFVKIPCSFFDAVCCHQDRTTKMKMHFRSIIQYNISIQYIYILYIFTSCTIYLHTFFDKVFYFDRTRASRKEIQGNNGKCFLEVPVLSLPFEIKSFVLRRIFGTTFTIRLHQIQFEIFFKKSMQNRMLPKFLA